MLTSLTIDNFRCFRSFELKQLGRLNLIVGKNNSGKTSLLEAVQLLCSESSLGALYSIAVNRGEYLDTETSSNRRLHVNYLFNAREIVENSRISLRGSLNELSCDRDACNLEILVSKQPESDDPVEFVESALSIQSSLNGKIQFKLPLSPDLALPVDTIINFNKLDRAILDPRLLSDLRSLQISSSLSNLDKIRLFEQVVLRPEEDRVVEALQIVEPKIERLAIVDSDRYHPSRGGFIVKLKDNREPVPIGNLGNGVWQVLGLALALVNSRNGTLLVDEIDTGLHFTALEDMWRLVWETAKKLNVQVFATTHSYDCWQSLGAIIEPGRADKHGITVHRIQKDAPNSIVYNESEINAAVKHDIEVR